MEKAGIHEKSVDDSPSAVHASLLMGRKDFRRLPDELVMMEIYPPRELYLFRNLNFFQVVVVSLKVWKQGSG